MKILFVNNNYQLGGAETVVKQLCYACRNSGAECTLFISDYKKLQNNISIKLAYLYPKILNQLYHSRFHEVIEKIYSKNQWTDKVFRKLAQSDADIIHIHAFHGMYASISSLAYLASKKKVIWTFHRFWGITGGCDHPTYCDRYLTTCGRCPKVGEWPIGPIDNTAEQLQLKIQYLSKAPLHIVSPSLHMLSRIKESRVGRGWNVCHIPNGVDLSLFRFKMKRDCLTRSMLGVDPKATTILIVNRNYTDLTKGYCFISEALKRCNLLNAQVLFIGGNTKYAIDDLPPGTNYVDFGYIDSPKKLAAIYEISDIFLYASPGENFPCVILEAMASKCCIVSTPTDGVLEQVDHGKSGLISEFITGESLATQLQVALSNTRLIVACGEKAREKANMCFSEQLMINRYFAFYEQLIKL